MSAATAAINTPEREGSKISIPVAASTTLYAGTLIARNSSGDAVSAADTAGLRVVGRAEETVDNSAGSAGDLSICVKRGVFRFANSGSDAVDANDEGKLCFVEDNQTVCEAGGSNLIVAGRVIDVDSDGVWVEVGYAPVRASVAATSHTITDSTGGSVSTSALAAMTGVDGTGSNAAPLTTTKNSISTIAAELVLVKADIAALKALIVP